jgi:hypothetical protein
MTSTAVPIAAAFSCACVLAGCGGADPLVRETAMQHAMDAVAREVADPGSGLYHHRIRLRSAVPFRKGWLVRVSDRTAGTVICVSDLPTETALGLSENLSIRPCRTSSAPAPAEPAPSTTTPSV